MTELTSLFINNKMIELLMLAVAADTILGILRAVRFRSLNSSIGINGMIRKTAMIFSVGLLLLADYLVQINMLAFVPDEYINLLGLKKIGLCELFGILFIACECISILKNMMLCGLPVPRKIREWLEEFLYSMTDELPAEVQSKGGMPRVR